MNIALDKYPHVLTKLGILWGHKDCGDYLDGLLYDTRFGRSGFSLPAAMELMLLSYVHAALYPKPGDVWYAVDR